MHTTCQFMRMSAIVCIAISNWSPVHAQISNGWFDDFRPVPGLNSPFRDQNPFVTENGLTIYFTSSRPVSTEPVDFSSFDIWMATRPSTTEPFEDAVKLEAPVNRNDMRDSDPLLFNDGLQLFFSTDSENTLSDIFMTSRESVSGQWGKLEDLGPAVNDPDSMEFSPSITADGLTMFFTSTRLNTDPADIVFESDLFQATRASLDEQFDSVMPLENVNTIFHTEMNASVSSDGLTVFYDTRRGRWGWETLWVATRSSTSEPFDNPMSVNDLGLGSTLNDEAAWEATPFVSTDWPAHGSKLYYSRFTSDWDIWEATWHVEGAVIPEPSSLVAGDADQDLDFDQLDLVKVQIAAKYLTAQPATWGDGDWNGAPGGSQGNPPEGDKLFDQGDIVSALQAGVYLTGPYAAIPPGGTIDDDQTSLLYDSATGELAVDAPAGKELTSINITSAGSLFIGDKPAVLDGAFDNFAADNIFKATFGGSFGDISFGNVLPAGLSELELLADLSAVGSLFGGGDLGQVDCACFIPEPTSCLLLLMGVVVLAYRRRRGANDSNGV